MAKPILPISEETRQELLLWLTNELAYHAGQCERLSDLPVEEGLQAWRAHDLSRLRCSQLLHILNNSRGLDA